MEINIIKGVQSIANSFLDVCFWFITKMGEEIFFLLVFAGIYLLYSKKFAFKYTFYYLVSVGVNAVVKILIRRPRPYVTSSEVINRLPASEYSFPSGHTQGFVVQATTGMQEIGKSRAKKSFKITALSVLIVMSILVMLSRLYWGQHYLSDTVVGLMLGIAVPFVIDYAIFLCPQKIKDKISLDFIINAVFLACMAGFVVCLIMQLALDFASRKVFTFLGVFGAMSVGYLLEKKYIKYEEKSVWWVTLLKGLITYAVLFGLYFAMNAMVEITGYVYFIVYFILGVVVSLGLPLLFKLVFKTKNTVVATVEDVKEESKKEEK